MPVGRGVGAATPSFLQMSQGYGSQALQAAGMQRPNSKSTYEPPDKTAGGAIMSGVGASAAGAAVGGAVAGSAGGPWGAAIGFVVGLGSYLIS